MMTKDDAFHCYLCGGSSYRVRPGLVRDNPSLAPLECEACGLVTLSSFDHISGNFYEDSRMHTDIPCAPDIINQMGYEDSARRYKDFLEFLVGRSVLDIGCGDGAFLALAKTVAARVAGVELDKQWKDRHQALDLRVVPRLSDLRPDDVFDTVTMFHVLEHIPDPLPFLEQAGTFLERGGVLIIEIPSAQDALLTFYENKPFSEFTYWSPHLFLHTPQTLEALLRKAGFATVDIRQFQRYPLANHLYWLAKGKPGGQMRWGELREPALDCLYAVSLAKLGKCDTIIGLFHRSNN